ncbi:PREDICTED: truncated transcription factor CAULIFLOWER A-like [Tarenaya hassleriana]|uniref:truncated transcription factor CAULIFLOWER A-like n=1 Tax=Tarenaya hassleriana TaxID=28532 RepID=UPI00053C1AFB|nr:PREDICTED: truncated transcription factor CAULIFLOWER A-like [Tarenaya hassleriana]
MGRGRVQLRRIENKIRRQVTFSKRRTGLVKKAQEISVLCDAEVALIIFSPKGKLFEYSAGSSMEKILDRYERCSYSSQELPPPSSDPQGNCSTECSKLLRMIDVLQRSLRHLKGEELDALSLRELQSLEMQLDTALKKTRTRKNQLMLESIAQLQKKEKELKELRNQLRKKLDESKEVREIDRTRDLERQNSSSFASPRPPPSLLGGREAGEADGGTLIRPPTNTTLPHWMPRCSEE